MKTLPLGSRIFMIAGGAEKRTPAPELDSPCRGRGQGTSWWMRAAGAILSSIRFQADRRRRRGRSQKELARDPSSRRLSGVGVRRKLMEQGATRGKVESWDALRAASEKKKKQAAFLLFPVTRAGVRYSPTPPTALALSLYAGAHVPV